MSACSEPVEYIDKLAYVVIEIAPLFVQMSTICASDARFLTDPMPFFIADLPL